MGALNRSTVIQVSHFMKTLQYLARKNGNNGVVKYLKVCHVMLMQSLPGSQLHHNPREIGKVAVARSRDGLPRVIPAVARQRIRQGHQPTIRLWLTLFGIYRILPAKGTVDYSTITQPGVEIPRRFWTQFLAFLPWFVSQLEIFFEDKLLGVGFKLLKAPEVYANTSASSDSSASGARSSFGARISSARFWVNGWGSSLYQYLVKIGQADRTNTFWEILRATASTTRNSQDYSASFQGHNCSGRLSVKVEAAGKHRVFAIVDYWTQATLRPLHDLLCSILKRIPQDGTFDQIRPLRELLDRVSVDQKIYSFDLTAATDRLALSLQESLLGVIFDREFATLWADLLVGRPYFCQVRPKKTDPEWIKYAVGQPIGAYSSWAILALTHHALVQFCWFSLGMRTWFSDYAILGDDVVIANDKVAQRYRAVCRIIGLNIGLAKSLIAVNRTCEFAKRLFFRGVDVSGVPMNLWNAAASSAGVALALVQRITVVVPQTFANVSIALGAGYKASSSFGAAWKNIPRRLQVLAVLFTHPLSRVSFARSSWLEWLLQTGPTLPVEGLDKMSQFTPWATSLLNEMVLPLISKLEDVQQDLFWRNPTDIAARLLDSKVNSEVVRLTESFEKMEAALKHLQKLDIKFITHQSSAIFSQVSAVMDRICELSRPSYMAQGLVRPDPPIVNTMEVFRTWTAIRRRVGLSKQTPSRPSN
jgi:hypothetical protein